MNFILNKAKSGVEAGTTAVSGVWGPHLLSSILTQYRAKFAAYSPLRELEPRF